MKRTIFGLLAGALAFGAAGTNPAAAQGYGEPIMLIARDMVMTPKGCRVTFLLRNRSTMRIQGARFWLRAADGNLETFWISDHRPATQETFEYSHCRALLANLYLVRARCNFRGILGRRNCMGIVRLVAGHRLRGLRRGSHWRHGHPRY